MNKNRPLDKNKIAFIVCTNDEAYLSECMLYIKHLNIPCGMNVEVQAVTEASSMASGYNEGMFSSDAKYKVYLHQDVFILNKDIISILINIFSDSTIGIVGPVGCDHIIKSADYVSSWNNADVMLYNSREKSHIIKGFSNNSIIDVEALDGLFLATQYDIEWDEKNFDGWDFYDISQCMRFHQQNYRVVASNEGSTWILHDEGFCKLYKYDKYRKIFCENYSEFGYDFSISPQDRSQFYYDYDKKVQLLKEEFKSMSPTEIYHCLENLFLSNDINKNIMEMYYIFLSWIKDMESLNRSIFWPSGSISDSISIFTYIKFLLWRQEYSITDNGNLELVSLEKNEIVSANAINEIRNHVCMPKYKLCLTIIIKDEADYIEEWIEYHLLVGVSHFYIYDNGSADNIRDVLEPYIEKKLVTYEYMPGLYKQKEAYNDAINKYKYCTEYMGFIDCDEYIVPKTGTCISEILDEIFAAYESTNNASNNNITVGGIGINWRMFGTSYHKTRPNGLITENYHIRADDDYFSHQHVKVICKPVLAKYFSKNPHSVEYLSNTTVTINEQGIAFDGALNGINTCNLLQLNHYYTHSEDEFYKKIYIRGWIDPKKDTSEESKRKDDIYSRIDMFNSVEDHCIDRFIPELKVRLQK